MNELPKQTEKKKEEINQTLNTSSIKKPKKLKKKKKAKKKKPEKECKNLKELLEQIKKENDEKILKGKKFNERNKEYKEFHEEDKEEILIKESLNPNNKSTSGTTTGTLSLDDNNIPNYRMIKNNDIIEAQINENIFEKRRKMSSPILEYYKGYDKFLSMEKEGSIDLARSMNFIEKNKFISSFNKNKKINKLYINPKDNDVKDKKKKNNKFNTNSYNENEMYFYNNNYIIEPIYNTFNSRNGNNDIQNMINNINNNINSYYYSNVFSFNNKKQNNKKSKTKKLNSENYLRIGDWTCSHCLNLNFSFRKICNRCNTPRVVV